MGLYQYLFMGVTWYMSTCTMLLHSCVAWCSLTSWWSIAIFSTQCCCCCCCGHPKVSKKWLLLALPTTKKARILLCFRFIIEYYSSLRDFGHYVIMIGLFFIMRIFERWWYFWFVLKLEIISYYRVIIYLEGFWFLLEDFCKDYILAWWNIWISIILLLPY
jgi:hypothetical protein